MPQFSKEVYYLSDNPKDIPIRKVFRIEAKNRLKAKPILDKMAELYAGKLKGRKPIDDVAKLKSIPKVKPSEVSERTIRMLQGICKTKKELK